MGLFSAEEPESFEVEGRTITCLVCRYDRFWRRTAQLHGGVATFFGLEWTSPTAQCAVCGQCGYIHWFLPLKDA